MNGPREKNQWYNARNAKVQDGTNAQNVTAICSIVIAITRIDK